MDKLEVLSIVLSLSSVICYLFSVTAYQLGSKRSLNKKSGASLLGTKNRSILPSKIAAAFGWLFSLGIFIKNWYVNGYIPFASMYQVLSALSLCFLLMYYLLIKLQKDKIWLFPYFTTAAAVPLIGTVFMDKQIKWSLVPALRSVYFVPHVFSYVLSYSLSAVAFVLALTALFAKDRKKYEDAVYSVELLAFPFMTAGLLLGAIWADAVWGNFWQWDIKEIWSLITCIFYLLYFHVKRTSKGEFLPTLFIILGFVSLIITFLFVNVLPQTGSLHTYT